jgi:O-antigen/teichoic acid export membrane protein
MEKESHVIAKNIVSQIIGRVVVLALSLISVKLVTNYLGPDGTGYYNTIITYFSFFITIADFGLFSVGVREIAKAPEKTSKILNNIFSIRFISAVAVTAVAVIIVLFTNYPPVVKYGVVLTSFFPIFNLLSSVYDIYLQSQLQMQKSATTEMVTRIFTVFLVYLTVVLNLGYYVILSSVAISAIINYFLKYFVVKKQIKIKFEFDKEIISWILKLSLPLGIVFIVNNFYFKVDTLILFYFKGASEVGIYSVAYKVLETTVFAAAFLAYSLKPLLSISVENNKKRASEAIATGFTFLLYMALVIGIVCIPFSKEIIVFLSSEAFVGGAPVLIILSFASIFIYLNVLFGEIMIAKDMRKYLIWVSVIVLLINIISNIILIPKYSYVAAAYTTLASEMLLILLGYLISRQILPISFDLFRGIKLLFCAFLSVILSMLLKGFGLNFILVIFVAIAFYLVTTYWIDAVPKTLINGYTSSLKQKWKK